MHNSRLLKVLHFITTKEIPLTKQCIKELSVVKSVTLQKQFKDKNKVTKLLNSPRGIQMKALLKLKKFYPHLLFYLFNTKEHQPKI